MTHDQNNPSTTPSAPAVWAQDLLRILHRQKTMLDDLLSHARQQATLIAQGRIDELLGLLAARQQIVEAFGESQQRLGTLTCDLADRLTQVDTDQREKIRTLIASVGEDLAQVLEIDEHDQSLMEGGMTQVRNELKALDASRRAHGAYAPAPTSAAKTADSSKATPQRSASADPVCIPAAPARLTPDGCVQPRFADRMG